MGCGASKFNAEGEALPARLRPLFRRRIEDIRRRRHASLKDVTPSKKELLLVDNGEEDENSNSTSLDDKSVRPSKDGLEKEGSAEGKDGDEREEKGVHSAIGEGEEEVKEGKHGEEEDDEGLLSNEEGELIFPGSPSFRVYFIDNLDDDKNDDDEFFEGKNESSTNKSQIGNDASSKLEETVTKKVKKGRKRRSFRKVIPKGGKNLLNVRGCYISACTPHGHTRLLTEKAHA